MPKRSRSASSRSSKRSRTSSKRTMVRSRRGPRGMRVSTRSHSFHRWITVHPSSFVAINKGLYDPVTSVISSTSALTGADTIEFALSFSLSALPNVSEFVNLFDAYMIDKVVVQIKMINNPDQPWAPQTTSNSSSNIYPTIWYTPDYDDSNNVTLAQIKEFERVRHKVLYPNRMINIVVRPKPVSQVYRTAITTGYQVNKKSMWLDLAQTDIPHYGLKTVIDFEGTTAQGLDINRYYFKVNTKFYFKCKSAR